MYGGTFMYHYGGDQPLVGVGLIVSNFYQFIHTVADIQISKA